MGIGKVLGVIGLIVFLWAAYLGYTLITLTPQIRAEWGYVDENTIELDVTVYFGKSLPVSINIEEADLYWAGIKVGTLKDLKVGFLKDSARGVLVLKNREVIEALKEHIRNGEQSNIEIQVRDLIFGIPIIRGGFSKPLKTDLLSYISNVTIESSGDLIKTPAIEGMPSKWGKIDENGIEILSDVELYNPNPVPLPLFGIKYHIDANGYQVARGELLEKVVIPANGRGTARIRTIVDTNVLPKVIAEHIKKGERSEVTLKLTLTVKMLNQKIEMPLPEIKETVETNIIEQLNLALS